MAEALSVVVPAFNEAGRIGGNLRALREALPEAEIVVSDDGSTDTTAAEAEALGDPGVRVLRNPHKGRGGALKAGLAAASGDIVVTVDADLSYGPEEVRRLFAHLRKYPACDLAIGSCYMPGGRVEGVPAGRLWASRIGNLLLRFAFHGRFHTTTGILRGYRREKLRAILPALVSDGKELYLEFLHKALAGGWQIEEVPATLTWRRDGGGKGGFPLSQTAWSHGSFAVHLRGKTMALFCLLLGLPLVVGVGPTVFLNAIPDSWILAHRWSARWIALAYKITLPMEMPPLLLRSCLVFAGIGWGGYLVLGLLRIGAWSRWRRCLGPSAPRP